MNYIYLETFIGIIKIERKGERLLVTQEDFLEENQPDQLLSNILKEIQKDNTCLLKYLKPLKLDPILESRLEKFTKGEIKWMRIKKKTNWNNILSFCLRLKTFHVSHRTITYMHNQKEIQIAYANGHFYVSYDKDETKENIKQHIFDKFEFRFEYNKLNKYFENTVFKDLIENNYPADEVYFDSLEQCTIWTIIGQMISSKAATTIFGKFLNIFKKDGPIIEFPSRQEILDIEDEVYIKHGMSERKIKVIKGALQHFNQENINYETLKNESNEWIRDRLTKIKGIGPWSTNVILMYYLKRENVFLPRDFGTQKGLMYYFNLDKKPTEKEALSYVNDVPEYKSYLCYALWKLKTKVESK